MSATCSCLPTKVRFANHISSHTFLYNVPPFVLSALLSSAVSVLLAYQLRVCQPPSEVPNAVMLMEDGELEIGEFSLCKDRKL